MQVVTLNANGIRSACKKGFLDWMLKQKAEVVCVQETRSQSHQLPDAVLNPPGWFGHFRDAERPGYSGVAIYTRREPDRLVETLGWDDADREARYIQADFGDLSVASIYLPSGTSGEERQSIKFDFMKRLLPVLARMRASRRQYILCGDWNIAHTKKDIKNWRGNQKHSGFLPEERAWMDQVFGRVGMVDAFRRVNQQEDQYTWWSNRGRAWEKNVGWRIDYQVVTPGLKNKVKAARIYKEKRFSDHAPLIIDYDVTLSSA
jgi:exodeoxyribonuclease-3